MSHMKFRQDRKHYLTPAGKAYLHAAATILFLVAVGWSLEMFSWIPMILFFALISIAEIFYWYDV